MNFNEISNPQTKLDKEDGLGLHLMNNTGLLKKKEEQVLTNFKKFENSEKIRICNLECFERTKSIKDMKIGLVMLVGDV